MRASSFILFATALILAACQTDLSGLEISSYEKRYHRVLLGGPGSCPTDWYGAGLRDGRTLGTVPRAEAQRYYGKACARAGREIEFARFEAGNMAGLRVYCTPQAAYWIGRDNIGGKYNPSQCDPRRAADLVNAYDAGRKYRDYSKKIRGIFISNSPTHSYSSVTEAQDFYNLPEGAKADVRYWKRKRRALREYERPPDIGQG